MAKAEVYEVECALTAKRADENCGECAPCMAAEQLRKSAERLRKMAMALDGTGTEVALLKEAEYIEARVGPTNVKGTRTSAEALKEVRG